MKIGAQLYTLREFCTTPEDFAQTLQKVAQIGYTTVQVSGTCDFDGAWLKTQLDRCGLTATVTHVKPDRLINETEQTLKQHQAFGCRRIGIGAAPGGISDETYDKFVSVFRPVAETLYTAGTKFYYHNHWKELTRASDGTPFLEQLCRDFPADRLGIIFDTYWAQYAGADPAYWIERLRGRVDCVHLKDMTCVDKVHRMMPIGEGNMNWEGILHACEGAGTEYAYVEQDNCNGEDPFECMRRSYRYLHSLGLD